MHVVGPATAEGDLERTPFAHLLVYAADRRLTGAMILDEPGGAEHVIQLDRGAAVKVRPGDGFALFGDLLVEDGLVSRETVDAALATRGLLGDVLLLSGCVDAGTLEWVAEVQFVKRMVRLFALPPDTRYRYFEGHAALSGWGGEPACVDPLALLWAGLREHGARSSRLEPMLERLGAAPLRLHPALVPGRFGFRGPELDAIERMQQEAPTLEDLLASGIAPAEALRSLVYALLITRYVELGNGMAPVGVSPSMRPGGASGSQPQQQIGRMQLRPTLHRLGAAAPDPVGDGERAPLSVRSRGRDPRAEPHIDDEPSGVTGPPSSSMRSITGRDSAAAGPSGPSVGSSGGSAGGGEGMASPASKR